VNKYIIVAVNDYVNKFSIVSAIIYFIFQEHAVNDILMLALIDSYMILLKIKFKLWI
jgi:hypothetical protein